MRFLLELGLWDHACDRTRGNDFEIKEERFRLDIRKKICPVRGVRHWKRLPREAVDAPLLEVIRARLDMEQPDLVEGKLTEFTRTQEMIGESLLVEIQNPNELLYTDIQMRVHIAADISSQHLQIQISRYTLQLPDAMQYWSHNLTKLMAGFELEDAVTTENGPGKKLTVKCERTPQKGSVKSGKGVRQILDHLFVKESCIRILQKDLAQTVYSFTVPVRYERSRDPPVPCISQDMEWGTSTPVSGEFWADYSKELAEQFGFSEGKVTVMAFEQKKNGVSIRVNLTDKVFLCYTFEAWKLKALLNCKRDQVFGPELLSLLILKNANTGRVSSNDNGNRSG
ncbi:hypothetical protein DUI87_16667 [Hirundo rustica rustica]|uniref:Uncharacterized protein n=1 Tax=Hirundo rustica rustica TaxID=333673 RepID=A0A3M0K457_HIRRU|nr:hypothetical protein DUI87_16667 [Hirundo rustica rustica]